MLPVDFETGIKLFSHLNLILYEVDIFKIGSFHSFYKSIVLIDIDRSLAAMESFRMLTVQVDLDSRKLGNSAMLLPLKDAWLASRTYRQFLQLPMR